MRSAFAKSQDRVEARAGDPGDVLLSRCLKCFAELAARSRSLRYRIGTVGSYTRRICKTTRYAGALRYARLGPEGEHRVNECDDQRAPQ